MPRNDEEESNTDQTAEKPKSSFSTYVAEGDKLYKKSEFRKAIESYSIAIEVAEEDVNDTKNCYVSRALCQLQMGDSEAALTDAEESLAIDENYIRGLYVKAEALFAMGDFEYALLYYHRGHNTRADFAEFKIGIQKSEEAIHNAIGREDGDELNANGDLSIFYNRDLTQNYITLTERRNKEKKSQSQSSKPREEKKPKDDKSSKAKNGAGKGSKKSSRRLLGEIYDDKKYLEQLFKDEVITNQDTESGKKIHSVTSDALQYLEKRESFWRQQNPSSVHDKGQGRRVGTAECRKNDPGKYAVRQMEKIEDHLEKNKTKQAERLCKDTISEVNTYNDSELANKQEILGQLHNLYGTAFLAQDKFPPAEKEFKKDLEISEDNSNQQGKARSYEALGRLAVKQENYGQAIKYWEMKLQCMQKPGSSRGGSKPATAGAKNDEALERTWLYHEIGRCHLEEGNYSEAKECGEKAYEAALIPDDQIWQLNARVLIAKAELKMEEYQLASESFTLALDLAKAQNAKEAEKAIERALKDVNSYIVKGMKAEDNPESDHENQREKTPSPRPDSKQEKS